MKINRIKYKYYCNGFPGKRKEEIKISITM